jgi:hypothetical protein
MDFQQFLILIQTEIFGSDDGCIDQSQVAFDFLDNLLQVFLAGRARIQICSILSAVF